MPSRWPVHTLVFDMDDTLYFERDYVLSGFRCVGAWVAETLGVEGLGEMAIRLFDLGYRGHIFDKALEHVGINATPELIDSLVRRYRQHKPKLELLPDAQMVLEWARPRFALAVVSDGYLEAQRLKLTALRLESFFSTAMLTDAWGREFWKPSTQGFRAVSQAVGRTESDGYIYIGDNPHKDFIGPRNLGWRTLRIRRRGGEYADYEASAEEAADIEISSLDQLPDIVAPIDRNRPMLH